jgi:hypothetical protein
MGQQNIKMDWPVQTVADWTVQKRTGPLLNAIKTIDKGD